MSCFECLSLSFLDSVHYLLTSDVLSIADALSRVSSPGIDEPLEDDDVEVDVEECSDGESSSPRQAKIKMRQSPAMSECGSEATEVDRISPDLAPERTRGTKMMTHCNCDELVNIECHLETKDLWDKFHDLGTEMIITKTGR